ncbi:MULTISPECIES: ABC1 kinase family protein [Tsukamurella]|uniref:ABC1 kinase family protein n=1 Tax=Tsukamurella TaxID=2060 RepID=UPI002DD4379A|nr:AarF/ABC1/UbiB kinase family protein [Tsukamurella tyrosinosolvens]MEC4614950.1 AarF/ABC1/UbiB kinase family protein [Tsukamurella tyrosinosolvens]
MRAAEQIVEVLSNLKGGSMKVGQMLSVIDIGLFPEDRRDSFRERLEALCAQAEPLPFITMRPIIEKALGPLDDAFAEFPDSPIGVASIGQVYRARLHDGRWVAVKVQYPGIREAIRSDVRNLKLFGKLLGAQWPTVRDGTLFDEIARNLVAELDYLREARSQASAAEAFRGHPYFVIPSVISGLCADNVLVTEYVDGTPLATAAGLPQSERDLLGEQLFRFYIGTLFERNEFCADPHFGNVLVLGSGRLCFLDFGQYTYMDPADVARELRLLRAACEGDGADARATLVDGGVFAADASITNDECLAFVRDASEWTVTDAPLRITSEGVTSSVLLAADPRVTEHEGLRRQRLPPTHLASRRAEFLAMGLIGRLESEANWHRIAREWIYGDEPATEMGERIAEWRRRRLN